MNSKTHNKATSSGFLNSSIPNDMNSSRDSDHEKLQGDLLAYYHHELPFLRSAVMRWHVTRCSDCLREMQIMRQINSTLTQAEGETQEQFALTQDSLTQAPLLRPELREKILLSLPPQSEPRTAPTPRVRSMSFLSWAAAGATACVLAAILLPTFSRSRENARRSTPQSEAMRIALSERQAEDKSRTAGRVPAAPPEKAQAFKSLPVESSRSSEQVSHGQATDSLKAGEAENSSKRSIDNNAASSIDNTARWARRGAAGKVTTQNTVTSAASLNLSPYRKVHKQASITVAVAVDELEAGSNAVEDLIKKAGGFVATNNLNSQSNGQKAAAMEIRVPSAHFEEVIKAIAALGEVQAKRITGEDITARVSDANEENNVVAGDLRIKLENYRQAKERAALKNKPVPDDWQQLADIRRMRVELAQVRARLELLKKMSDYASLSVQLREESGVAAGAGTIFDLGRTSRNAYESLLLASRLPLTMLIYVLVFSPFWFPILLVWRFLVRTDPRRAGQP